MKLPGMLLGLSLLPLMAQAQDQISTLDLAAGQLHQCIARQTAAQLEKRTTPRRFGIVLRDKCRIQEQRFKAVLIDGLKKEGSKNPYGLRLVDELLTSLRKQSVVNYAEILKHSR